MRRLFRYLTLFALCALCHCKKPAPPTENGRADAPITLAAVERKSL